MEQFFNPNATKDAQWDAGRGLGNRNSYNEGSASWHAYERAYSEALHRKLAIVEQKAAAWYHFEVYHQMLSAERADKYKDVYRRWAREAQEQGAKRSALSRRLMGL